MKLGKIDANRKSTNKLLYYGGCAGRLIVKVYVILLLKELNSIGKF